MGNCFPTGIFIKRYFNLEKQSVKEIQNTEKKKENITIIENYIDEQNDNHKLNELIDYLDSHIPEQSVIHSENFNKNIRYNTFIITRIKKNNIKRQNTV
jgi:hypothetical protein